MIKVSRIFTAEFHNRFWITPTGEMLSVDRDERFTVHNDIAREHGFSSDELAEDKGGWVRIGSYNFVDGKLIAYIGWATCNKLQFDRFYAYVQKTQPRFVQVEVRPYDGGMVSLDQFLRCKNPGMLKRVAVMGEDVSEAPSERVQTNM